MAAIEQKSLIDALPNEILANILYYLPAKSLLPLAGVSHRFCAIILRELQGRLSSLASLDSWTLEVGLYQVLHGYDDVACFDAEYIDTPGLFDESVSVVSQLARLPTVYSRYRHPQPSDTKEESNNSAKEMKNKRIISLDSEAKEVELTSSFNYYPDGTTSMAGIVMLEGDGGYLNLSRDWLNEQADRLDSLDATHRDDGKDEIAWLDGEKNIGFKFRVERKEFGNIDEMAITYNYELLIEEVLIRPVYILLMRNAHFYPEPRRVIPLDP